MVGTKHATPARHFPCKKKTFHHSFSIKIVWINILHLTYGGLASDEIERTHSRVCGNTGIADGLSMNDNFLAGSRKMLQAAAAAAGTLRERTCFK